METEIKEQVKFKRNVQILPPEAFTGIKLSEIKKRAGGIPAIYHAFKHVTNEMGMFPGLKTLFYLNQKGKIDCPGCAWPDPQHRSVLGEYCENGAKALAEEATSRLDNPAFFAKYSVEELSTWSDYKIGKSGRITHPMYLPKGKSHYEPVSWNTAFRIIAEELNALDSPDEAIFYTSGRTSNEAAFMYQLFVREFGTNNLPDCSNMCHESSGSGLSETVGIGKGSVTLEDLYEAEVIVVMGQNPGTNHPRMLNALKKCRRNGGTIVSVNPIPEAGLTGFTDPQSPVAVLKGGDEIAHLHLPVKINGDLALMKGIAKLMLQAEEKDPGSVFDHAFIENFTEGMDDYLNTIREVNPDEMVKKSGISLAQMKELAELFIKNKKIIICWAMGLTQQPNGVQNIREVVNLLLLKGSIGKPGAGTCPVRGHSNVQGDRTMGIWEKPPQAFLDRLEKHFGFHPAQEHGFDTVDAIRAMADGRGKVFIGMGGNFISATPDSEYTGKAMQNCRLTVQVSTKLNRAHLVTGEHALILPCLARSEKDVQDAGTQVVTVENSMGQVHISRGHRSPASQMLLSEPAIIAGMAKAVLGDRTVVAWDEMVKNYDLIRDHIEACIPGFENYNQRVRHEDGFYLPNVARERKFTLNGKANFTVNEVPDNSVPAGHYVMMTIRSHDQYNTTIYGLDDRYRGIKNERRVVMMNADDMKAAGLKTGEPVNITSYFRGEQRFARNFLALPYPIPRGNVATYFPEANVLVPLNSVAWKSNTPASKFVDVTIEKMKG